MRPIEYMLKNNNMGRNVEIDSSFTPFNPQLKHLNLDEDDEAYQAVTTIEDKSSMHLSQLYFNQDLNRG